MAEPKPYATGCHDLDEEIFSLRARAEKAEQENARLREALEKLEDAADDSDSAQYGTLSTSFVRNIARTVLGGE